MIFFSAVRLITSYNSEKKMAQRKKKGKKNRTDGIEVKKIKIKIRLLWLGVLSGAAPARVFFPSVPTENKQHVTDLA